MSDKIKKLKVIQNYIHFYIISYNKLLKVVVKYKYVSINYKLLIYKKLIQKNQLDNLLIHLYL